MPFGFADIGIRGGIGIETNANRAALPGDCGKIVDQFTFALRLAVLVLEALLLPAIDADQPKAREPLLIGFGRFLFALRDNQRRRRVFQRGQRAGREVGTIARTFGAFVLDRPCSVFCLSLTRLVRFQAACTRRLSLPVPERNRQTIAEFALVALPAQHRLDARRGQEGVKPTAFDLFITQTALAEIGQVPFGQPAQGGSCSSESRSPRDPMIDNRVVRQAVLGRFPGRCEGAGVWLPFRGRPCVIENFRSVAPDRTNGWPGEPVG